MARPTGSPLATWSSKTGVFLAATLLSTSAQAVGFSCDQVVADRVLWNFIRLAGSHSVVYQDEEPPKLANWTFSINLCSALNLDKNRDEEHQCPLGTRVCGVKTTKEGDAEPELAHWVALAGDYSTTSGIHLDVKPTRIKHSASNSDLDKEGVRLEMTGGRDPLYPKNGKKGTKQKAIIELLCNKEMTGWEPENDPLGARKRDESEDEGSQADSEIQALKYISYGPEAVGNEAWDVLRLEWNTKYACEDAAANIPPTEHWGFFTWLLILIFLGVAAYVIFGSWVNYTKYGVTGFDAVPHADALRDIPYVLKDIFRRFQGGGSRGGYSAV